MLVLLSFLAGAFRVTLLAFSEFSAELEEVFKFSEKENEEALDPDDLKNDPLHCNQFQLTLPVFITKKSNQLFQNHYNNPLIEIPDSPPKLKV